MVTQMEIRNTQQGPRSEASTARFDSNRMPHTYRMRVYRSFLSFLTYIIIF